MMKIFKLILLWLVISASVLFDRNRYSVFDFLCFLTLFWFANEWMVSAPPTGFFYFAIMGALSIIIGVLSGFFEAALKDIRRWLGE